MQNHQPQISDELRETLGEFLNESRENLDQMDIQLLALEKKPDSRDLIDNIFRAVHTLKGSCGFLAFTRLEGIAHAGENLLDAVRSGKLKFTQEIATVLLTLSDGVRRSLNQIESTGTEGKDDFSDLVIMIQELQDPAPKPKPAALPAAASTLADPESQQGPALGDSIRVDVSLLDKLMNLVGELVLTRNQMLQLTTEKSNGAFLGTAQRLNMLTTELQEGVMKTRMQPLSNIWSKFPRIVRDLSMSCGKQVRLEMKGQETETDKSIIEAIKDPLTHLLRNAVDHGIESTEERTNQGKPPEGRVSLHAFHEGGQVIIEMSDDGKGIDPEQIKQSALKKELITADQAASMSEREAMNLIFLPGFSTAAQITNVSGRGVGMDVVVTNLEKIGGALDINSQPGKGTVFKIKIPLTLAIIPALIISTQGERYAIPQVNLLELVRLQGEETQAKVEMIHGTPVYRLRGKLLPLVFLNSFLKPDADMSGQHRSDANIIILRAGEREFGLVVDAVYDTKEIVVKPLGKHLKSVSAFSGATIMGDGRVALILDIYSIAQAANIVSLAQDQSLMDVEEEEDVMEKLLVFQVGEKARMAIPLPMIARLEEFNASSVEKSGHFEVVQYQGRIMPLIQLENLIYLNPTYSEPVEGAECEPMAGEEGSTISEPEEAPLEGEEKLKPNQSFHCDHNIKVVVLNARDHYAGLVVSNILDIVSDTITLQRQGRDFGILGSAVINGHVTDMLDVRGVLKTVDPLFLKEIDNASHA